MTDNAARITGGCLCGAVRFEVSAGPLFTRACWCHACQHLGAGSGTVNVGFPAAAMTIEGPTTDYIRTADSGNVMHRRFCPQCGSPMFSAAESRPEVIIVRAGALDDPEIGRPQMTIWTEAAPSWACIDADLPSTPRQPPPPPPAV